MVKVVWKKEMSVGNKILDKQHKDIIEHFNHIDKILSSRKTIEIGQIRETMHFTYEYIKNHFKYEEACMMRAKLPGFKSHIKIHKTLIKIFDDFVRDFNDLYKEEYISSLDLSRLLAKFERDVIKNYVRYMIKELAHLKKYKLKLASCC